MKNYCIEQSTKAMSAAICIISRNLVPPYVKASSPTAAHHWPAMHLSDTHTLLQKMWGLGHLINPHLFLACNCKPMKEGLGIGSPTHHWPLSLGKGHGKSLFPKRNFAFYLFRDTSTERTWATSDHFSISPVAARNYFLGGVGETRILF